MWTRIITGMGIAPLLIWVLVAGPNWASAGVLMAAGTLCVWELLAMAMPEHRFERFGGTAIALATFVLLYNYGNALAEALILGQFALGLLVLLRPAPIDTAMLRLGTLWATMTYIVLPIAFGIDLSVEGWQPIVLVLFVVWAGDTGAYFSGRLLGRHKLYPAVSPNKTIEGAIGGLVASTVFAIAFCDAWMPAVSVPTALFLGLGGGIVAQIGDLVESLIKRGCGVKDSGTILPGHGGILDRVDGVIFVFPLYWAVLH